MKYQRAGAVARSSGLELGQPSEVSPVCCPLSGVE